MKAHVQSERFSCILSHYQVEDCIHAPLVGEFKEIAHWVRQKDISCLSNLLKRLVSSSHLELTHPLDGVFTQARASIRLDKVNFIFFSDDSGAHRWILAQQLNFADAVIVPNRILSLVPRHSTTIRNRFNEWLRLRSDQDALFGGRGHFAGVLVAHRTPFHFFYDFLKNLTPLVNAISRTGKSIYFDPAQCFFPLAAISGMADCRVMSKDDGILLSPLTIQQNDLNALGQPYNDSLVFDPDPATGHISDAGIFASGLMEEMESCIRTYQPDRQLPIYAHCLPDREFVLWVGISDLKRSWIEQVEGYAHIITRLAQQHCDLIVVFDGMTAPVDSVLSCPGEKAIVAEVVSLMPEGVRIFDLVGETYLTKVMFAQHVTAFISDAGTAAMVPLRFCRKPGVMYSNGKICSFPAKYRQRLELLDQKLVTTVSPDARGQFVSFSIDWQHLLQALIRVLPDESRFDSQASEDHTALTRLP